MIDISEMVAIVINLDVLISKDTFSLSQYFCDSHRVREYDMML
jgi:hypothetical protein